MVCLNVLVGEAAMCTKWSITFEVFYALKGGKHIVATVSVCPSFLLVPWPANNFKTTVDIQMKLDF